MQENNAAPKALIIAAPTPLIVAQLSAARTNYATRNVPRKILNLVFHSTEGHEGPTQDTNVARMFAGPLETPRSAHYVGDTNSITQCVPDNCIAWHCGRTGNARGLGFELCGTAKQTREEWLDALSLPMLELAARWAAVKCRDYNLPVRFVDAAALRQGAAGITTHREVSLAWHESNHTDPGPAFPMDAFIGAIHAAHQEIISSRPPAR